MSGARDAPARPAAFDEFADTYDEALAAGLSVTGESKEYFARRRVEWLAARLRALGASTRAVLDFGCGTGSAVPYLLDALRAERVLGVDISEASLAEGRATHRDARVAFLTLAAAQPVAEFDVAFCNGVFHHIPPAERLSAARYVRTALRAGGVFALWENNPWNPGTRYIMRRVAFDRDAITLTPPETRALLRAAGFEIVRTDFLFIFPHALRALRPLEAPLAPLPLGGQYLTLARTR